MNLDLAYCSGQSPLPVWCPANLWPQWTLIIAVSDGEETLQSENEDSNESWTTQDEIPAELIIKLASK